MPSLRGIKNRVVSESLTRYYRSTGIEIDGPTRFYGRPRFARADGSRIIIDRNVAITSNWRANDLDANWPCTIRTLNQDAVLRIGQHTGLSSTTISAAVHIEIGKRVLIGSGVLITDSDHHVVSPLNVEDRRFLGPPAPAADDAVIVEDDVFIGARTIVLKGTRIGRGTVIGAGSVVSGVLEPMSIYAGNPAKLLRVNR
ncbi:acyltransferase [Rhodococcus sp. SORGH_AS_0301]|uniref:acyltransferase n=1 Tax=Rhodococcus sp. SORGH_AS_0301 TaxID=3041780 RepID=UPI00358FBFD3